ncbi:MAG: cytochrome c oxidase subunit II [Phycisphaerales bacterium]|nr:cytochrome c oxidase subunit II [Phycisphaerales bacterium]|tara:strand:- start:5390 stop:6595 length:1206 start_codon:yes stop_codon:yes gene_type:complete
MISLAYKMSALLAGMPSPSEPASVEGVSTPSTFWMPEGASTQAPITDHLFDFINWICYIFLVLVTVALVYFAVKYRQRKGQAFKDDAPVHNTPLELTWTMVPMLLVIAIFYLGMVGYIDLRRSPSNAYEVSVTAQQWSWGFNHPEFGVTQGGEVFVPMGRPVQFLMGSADVLHSCFIPAFRVKQDIVPGRYSRLWFEATKPGSYQLYCTEYCGLDHSKMNAIVHVLPEDEFQAAMGKLATEYLELPESDLPNYALTRLYNRCSSCHSLDGKSVVGPSFKGLWDRTVNGETRFQNGQQLSDLIGPGKEYEMPEDYIRSSILNPQAHIVQNYAGAMPSFQGQLKERQVTALVLMMKYLDRLVDEEGNPIQSPDLSDIGDGSGGVQEAGDAVSSAAAKGNGEMK